MWGCTWEGEPSSTPPGLARASARMIYPSATTRAPSWGPAATSEPDVRGFLNGLRIDELTSLELRLIFEFRFQSPWVPARRCSNGHLFLWRMHRAGLPGQLEDQGCAGDRGL